MSNIDNLTYKELREIANLFGNTSKSKNNPYKVGEKYFIRTVTMSIVGMLEVVYDDELVLLNASWIADTGRFSDALKKGFEAVDSSEIEPFNANEEVVVGRGSIVDATIWSHKLPTQQK